MRPNKAVVYMVVGTLAFAVIMYVFTLWQCSTKATEPPDKILTAFKDLAIFASGALAALLSRTGSMPDPITEQPPKVEVTNKPNNPIPTIETT